jgi:hypothetical protein
MSESERRGLRRREAIAGLAAAGAGARLYVLLRGGPDDADSAGAVRAGIRAGRRTST